MKLTDEQKTDLKVGLCLATIWALAMWICFGWEPIAAFFGWSLGWGVGMALKYFVARKVE